MAWPWQRSSLRDKNYLDFVPRRIVDSEEGEADGSVVVLMPRYRDFFFGRFLQPLLRGDKRFIRVPLDPRGSWLWARVDGRRTVGELAREFRGVFPQDDEQVNERVCRYVAAMVGHGFMGIVGSTDAQRSPLQVLPGGNSNRKRDDMAEPNSGPCRHPDCLDGQETGGTINSNCWLCGDVNPPDGVIYFCPTHNPVGALPLTSYDEDGCTFCKGTGSSPNQAGGFGNGGGEI